MMSLWLQRSVLLLVSVLPVAAGSLPTLDASPRHDKAACLQRDLLEKH